MSNAHSDSLQAARNSLLHGIKSSGQSRYGRRLPDPQSLPHYETAKRLLSEILEATPGNFTALTLMSELYENFLEYDLAIEYFKKAIQAGEPQTHKTLKRFAALQENANDWRELLLTPAELQSLGEYLEEHNIGPEHHNLNLTREWLRTRKFTNIDAVVAALYSRGGYTDLEVLANVVRE